MALDEELELAAYISEQTERFDRTAGKNVPERGSITDRDDDYSLGERLADLDY